MQESLELLQELQLRVAESAQTGKILHTYFSCIHTYKGVQLCYHS